MVQDVEVGRAADAEAALSPSATAPVVAALPGNDQPRKAVLVHARGEEIAEIGDSFVWHDGRTWEIVGFTNRNTYSPASLGGTPVVVVRQIAGEPDTHMQQWADANGHVEWCGDSVGAGLFTGRVSKGPSA